MRRGLVVYQLLLILIAVAVLIWLIFMLVNRRQNVPVSSPAESGVVDTAPGPGAAMPVGAQPAAVYTYDSVLVSFGPRLRGYVLEDIVMCQSSGPGVECDERLNAQTLARLQRFFPGEPLPGRHVRLSPVREVDGVDAVDVWLKIDSLEPGFGGGEIYRVTLDRRTAKVLSNTLRLAETYPIR